MGNSHSSSAEANYALGQKALKNKDKEQAFKFFHTGAEQGHLKSQRTVAKMYLTGRGVEKNESEAAKWFHKAAQKGSPPAQYQYGMMLQKGIGVAVDEAKAVKYLKMAASDGDPKAQVEYGRLCETGACGVKQSKSAAQDYFERAAHQEHLPGKEALARLLNKDPYQQDIDLIESGLYLGCLKGAEDLTLISKHKITHNLYLHTIEQKEHPNITYKKIVIRDAEDEDINSYFNECFEFIQEALSKNGIVLVNCQLGMSRSATIVAMYLMKKHKWSAPDAIHFIQVRRSISLNSGFLSQLKKYEKEIYK